jgi:hypothetical protein
MTVLYPAAAIVQVVFARALIVLATSISQAEVDALRAAWGANPQDIGVGVYNPQTGETHIMSMQNTGNIGHDGVIQALGLTASEWMGYIVTSDGTFWPQSGLNVPWTSTHQMPANAAAAVQQALRAAGLI